MATSHTLTKEKCFFCISFPRQFLVISFYVHHSAQTFMKGRLIAMSFITYTWCLLNYFTYCAQRAMGMYSSDNWCLTSHPTWGAPIGKAIRLLTMDEYLFSDHNFLKCSHYASLVRTDVEFFPSLLEVCYMLAGQTYSCGWSG